MSDPHPRRTVRVVGEHATHRHIWRAARLLDHGPDTQERREAMVMASTLFVYLAFEAFLNDVGSRICPDAWANERQTFGASGDYRGTLGKCEYLLKQCGLPVERGRRPFQTAVELDRRRDLLVHGRPFSVDRAIEYVEPKQPRWEEAPILALSDARFLERATTDVEQLCDAMHVAARPIAEHLGTALESDRAFYGVVHQHRAWVQK
jgi:hypothetical protein